MKALLKIFTVNDKTALIYFSKELGVVPIILQIIYPGQFAVMMGRYLQLPPALMFFIKLNFIISFESIFRKFSSIILIHKPSEAYKPHHHFLDSAPLVLSRDV